MANYVMKMPSSFVELSAEEMTYDGGMTTADFNRGLGAAAIVLGCCGILGGCIAAVSGVGAPAAIILISGGMSLLALGIAQYNNPQQRFFGF